MKLENKVIAITGAGGVICSEFAKALAKEGAKVALLDINYESAITQLQSVVIVWIRKCYIQHWGSSKRGLKENFFKKAEIRR